MFYFPYCLYLCFHNSTIQCSAVFLLLYLAEYVVQVLRNVSLLVKKYWRLRFRKPTPMPQASVNLLLMCSVKTLPTFFFLNKSFAAALAVLMHTRNLHLPQITASHWLCQLLSIVRSDLVTRCWNNEQGSISIIPCYYPQEAMMSMWYGMDVFSSVSLGG